MDGVTPAEAPAGPSGPPGGGPGGGGQGGPAGPPPKDAPSRPEPEGTDRPGSEGGEQDAAVPNAERVAAFANPYIVTGSTGVRQDGPVFGGESYGFVGTLNRIVAPPAAPGRAVVGPVEQALLDKVRAVFVRPPLLDRALKVLADRRVVILQGRAHWGKATAALWLLGEVGGEPSPAVYAVAPDIRLDDLPSCFDHEQRPRGRYVIDTLADPDTLRLSVLRHVCGELRGGCLVITVDGRTPLARGELAEYLVPCDANALPDRRAVLHANLRWRLGRPPPDDLMDLAWVRAELGRGPMPAHLDQLAGVLASVGRGDLARSEAEQAYRQLARRRVEEWFESHPDLHERCMMLATAVLNGASYHEVADGADALRLLLDPPAKDEPVRPRAWGLGSARMELVEGLGARVSRTMEPTDLGPSPAELIELEDPSLQLQVLDHVWWAHDDVRGPLLDWLDHLGRAGTFDVSGRAAAAVGALCRGDFRYLHTRLLLPWATANDWRTRVAAAAALDVLAADPELAERVRTLLHRWIEHDPGSATAWTAVVAYGFTTGRRWPKPALRDLRFVAEEAPHHVWVVSQSLVNLCQAGNETLVLERLAAWSRVEEPPDAGPTALRVSMHMLTADWGVGRLSTGAPNGGAAIPVLLRLAADDGAHRRRIVELWKQAFALAETRKHAASVLDRWIELADESPEVGAALDVVATDLLYGTRDEQEDLAEILRERARDPRRPSRTARRYLAAIGQEVDR